MALVALTLAGCTASGAPGGEDPADAAATNGAACLEGEWDLDLESLLESMRAGATSAGIDARVDGSGEAWTSFADGVATSTYADQSIVMTLAVEGQEIVTTVVVDGTTTASYTATDTELSVTDLDMAGLTETTSATVDGQAIEVPELDEAGTLALMQDQTSAYSCDADELLLIPSADAVEGFTQRLTRR